MSEQRAVVRQEHARIGKKIINFDTGGGYGVCAWSDCHRDACSLYEVRVHEHARNIGCGSEFARHVTYAFCRETCKQYWLAGTGAAAHETAARNRGAVSGMLPAGWKKSVL